MKPPALLLYYLASPFVASFTSNMLAVPHTLSPSMSAQPESLCICHITFRHICCFIEQFVWIRPHCTVVRAVSRGLYLDNDISGATGKSPAQDTHNELIARFYYQPNRHSWRSTGNSGLSDVDCAVFVFSVEMYHPSSAGFLEPQRTVEQING